MLRAAYNDFLNWKNSPYRKPLIVNGARQTGKTWLLKEFGRNEYKILRILTAIIILPCRMLLPILIQCV